VRRVALLVLGVLGVLLLAACGGSSDDDGGAIGGPAIESCPRSAEVPDTFEGAIPVERRLAAAGAATVPVRLTVVDAKGCTPLPGLTVEAWTNSFGGSQRTNDAGLVTFAAPAAGATELHVRVLDGERQLHVGTVALGSGAVDRVVAVVPEG
jgi:hypothetical protein